jgi:hypothetical protein
MIVLGSVAGAGVHTLGVLSKAVPIVKIIPPHLGTAYDYSVVGTTINNSGVTTVNKNIGCSAAAAANSGMSIGGEVHIGDTAGLQAVADVSAAYTYYLNLPNVGIFDGDLAGKTFIPGVYLAAAAITNSGILNLNGTGYPEDALFVFQITAAFAPAAGSSLNLINCNANQIVWVCVGAPSTGAGSHMQGTIISVAAITVGINADIKGRVLSHAAAITLSANVITTT